MLYLSASSRKVADSNPNEVIGFFNWPNPSSRTMALESAQPLNRNEYLESSWGKGRPAREPDNLAAICEPII
jgi:hypothetical protein